MKPTRRRALTGISGAPALPGPRAVAVFESTWAHRRPVSVHLLAHQARFAPPVALSNDNDENRDVASATWIGNFGRVGPLDPLEPPPEDDDPGNRIRITLHREADGGGRLDGLLGGSDSGGWARLRDDDGSWGIVGSNVAGTGGTTCGTHSFFVSVSGLTPWLGRVLPGIRIVA